MTNPKEENTRVERNLNNLVKTDDHANNKRFDVFFERKEKMVCNGKYNRIALNHTRVYIKKSKFL